jgi:quinoprotein glucose dehydrogenase
MSIRRLAPFLLVIVVSGAAVLPAQTPDGEWRYYSGDPGSTKYSPLDQIDKTTVKNLRIAWRRPAIDPGLIKRYGAPQISNNFRATPLMINGVLYSPNAVGLVEAFDAGSGTTVWIQEPPPGREGPRGDSTRGLSYWRAGSDEFRGKQYIVVAVGSRERAAEFVAFSLP